MSQRGGFTLSEPEAIVTLNEAFAGFKDHFDGHRVSTELKMHELLKSIHPEFHITLTTARKMDFFGYAAAGHADATLDSDEDTMDFTRDYQIGSQRDSHERRPCMNYGIPIPTSAKNAFTGTLHNHIRFGRWRYRWESFEYLLYEIQYPDRTTRPESFYVVLSPRPSFAAQEEEISATDQLLLAVGSWSAQLHDEIYVYDDGSWRKSRELWDSIQGSSWDDVILDPKMKENLINDVEGFFENKELYKKFAVPWKRGVILHGVPGNGKTISIKTLINTLNSRPDPVSSLYVKSFEACRGEKASIQKIFDHARRMAPCLLIFEDLDSLVTDETRSYFLNEVDGLESNDGILMIGSANHLDKLDPAISKRPSRFDRKYHFNLPGEAERAAYCRFWRNKLAGGDFVDFQDEVCELIAKLTEGFSFAYMKELFVIVLLTIARGGTGDELESEIEEVTDAASAQPSEDGHVIVEHEDAKVDDTPDSKDVGKSTPIPKTKRTMPEVATPEHLADSVLLKVMKGQIKMLLEEMDNSEEEALSDKKGKDGEVKVVPRRIVRRMRGP